MQRALSLFSRILVVLLVAGAIAHVVLRVRLLNDPRVDLGGAEINVVYGTQKLLLGRPLYTDPEQAPFEVVQYTPLFHLCSAGLGILFGVDPHDSAALFEMGRALALALNLITAELIFLLCIQLGANRWMAAGAAALSLAFLAPHFFSRPDALATPLLLGMLLLLARHADEGIGWRSAWWAAVLAVLAVLAKQTAIIAPVIAIAFFLVIREKLSALRMLLAVAGIGAVAAAALLLTASPLVLWKNLVLSTRNGFGFTMYHELFDLGIFKYHLGWFMLLLVASIALRKGNRGHRLIAFAALIALASGLVSGMKQASSLNYLVDGQLLGLVAAMAWIGGMKARLGAWAFACTLVYGALFAQHRLQLLRKLVGTATERAQHASARAADIALHTRLIQGMSGQHRPVLISYRGHLELMMNGQGLLPQKDIIQWSTAPPFDLSGLRSMLDQGQVARVITDAPIDSLRLLGWAHAVELERADDGRFVYRLAPRD